MLRKELQRLEPEAIVVVPVHHAALTVSRRTYFSEFENAITTFIGDDLTGNVVGFLLILRMLWV